MSDISSFSNSPIAREGSLDSCDVLEKEIFIIDNSDEPDTYNDEGFCRENGCLTEASKEEMRR